jgi:hypothetical protein
LEKQLDYLKLPYCNENFRSLAAEANTQLWSRLDYLARLVEGEATARQDRAVVRPVKAVPAFQALKPGYFSVGLAKENQQRPDPQAHLALLRGK